jgi:hypothetical protein
MLASSYMIEGCWEPTCLAAEASRARFSSLISARRSEFLAFCLSTVARRAVILSSYSTNASPAFKSFSSCSAIFSFSSAIVLRACKSSTRRDSSSISTAGLGLLVGEEAEEEEEEAARMGGVPLAFFTPSRSIAESVLRLLVRSEEDISSKGDRMSAGSSRSQHDLAKWTLISKSNVMLR